MISDDKDESAGSTGKILKGLKKDDLPSEGKIILSERERKEIKDELEKDKLLETKRKRDETIENLVTMVERAFEKRASRRKSKENQWLRAQRLWLGSVASGHGHGGDGIGGGGTAREPFGTHTNRKRPDFNIVKTKCDIALSHVMSMQFAGGEKNWSIVPPNVKPKVKSPLDIEKPLQNVNPNDVEASLLESKEEVQSGQAKAFRKAKLMEEEIEEQLEQSDYITESEEAMWSWVVLGTGIMKGPVNTGKLKKVYNRESDFDGTSVWIPSFSEDIYPRVTAVSPWFVYLDDTTNDHRNQKSIVEVHPWSKQELIEKIKHPGFIGEAIKEAISIPPEEGLDKSFSDFSSLSDTNPNLFAKKFIVLEYHGPITRKQIDTVGVKSQFDLDDIPDENLYGEVWVVNGQMIRFELSVIEGAFSPPYSITVWEKDPASPYGHGVPSLVADPQRVVSQAWHMILDNASMSSGPQIVIQQSVIEPANGEWEFHPRKVWINRDLGADNKRAFEFFITPNVINELSQVLQMARSFAEEESGIPLLNAGLGSPESVVDSATGTAQLNRNSTVLLDRKAERWDSNITEPLISRMYDWNMQFNEDDSIKGNFNIRVLSSTDFRNKQAYIKDLEKVSVETANNPEMAKRINQGALQRARLSMMQLPYTDIIMDEEEVAEAERKAAENKNNTPDPASIKALAELEKLELDKARLELDFKKLEFEQTLNQQRETLESQERLAATQARLTESQAQILKADTDREIALINLAAKEESAARRDQILIESMKEDSANKKFIAGLQHLSKTRQQVLTQAELELAQATGKGI